MYRTQAVIIARSPIGAIAWRWGPTLLHILLALPTMSLFCLGKGAEWVLMLGGISVILGYPALVRMEVRRAPLKISPQSFWFAWNWVGLGWSALWLSTRFASGESGHVFVANEVPAEQVAAGYCLYWVGAIALQAGMALTRPPPVSSDAQGTSWASTFVWPRRAMLVLWGVSAAARVFPLGAIGQLGGPIQTAGIAMLAALAIQGAIAARRSSGWWMILALGTGLEFVLSLRTGSKASIMFAFLPLLWGALLSRRPGRATALVSSAMVALYFGFVQPAVQAFRNSEATSVVQAYQGRAPDVAGGWDYDQFLNRQFESIACGYIVGRVAQQGFLEGESMKYFLYAWVPRVVWPDKPNVTRGDWFDYEVRGTKSSSALGQTAQGELFWNFGIAGVMLGMMLIGLLVGVLWRISGEAPLGNPIRMWIYVALTLTMVDMSEAGSAIMGKIILMANSILLLWITGGVLRARAWVASKR
jgi:hypothetical protein